jgi:predicted ATPase
MTEIAAANASVLLSFRAENVRSFKDGLELSMLSSALSEPGVPRQVRWREGGKPVGVLPVAGIFGANASGKSNALRAMGDMRFQVLQSFRHGSPTGGVPTRPFRLDPAMEKTPSKFEIELILHGVRHEYGFTINSDRVIEEWAYRYPRGRPALLFRREEDDVAIGGDERTKSRAVLELLRPNALYLSTAASANHPILLPLYEWFERNLWLAQAESRSMRQAFTTRMLEDPDDRDNVLALLRAADLGVTGARVRELDAAMKEQLDRVARALSEEAGDQSENAPPLLEIQDFEVRLSHKGAEGDVELSPFNESLGTMVWFGLVGPVIDALAEGAVLLVDELDASLHPALVTQLVRLFQQPDTNPHRGQLIFNSHDITVLGDSKQDRPIGRDQIWFTEKREDGSTRLYPLTDLDPRKDEAIGRRYLAGRYGGTPILSAREFDRVAQLITSGSDGGT